MNMGKTIIVGLILILFVNSSSASRILINNADNISNYNLETFQLDAQNTVSNRIILRNADTVWNPNLETPENLKIERTSSVSTQTSPISTPAYTSQPPNVPDTSPPSIFLSTQIVDFNKNGQLEEGEKLIINYGAKDESGVKSIKLLVDGNLKESRNNEGTYQTTTDSLSMGTHTIVVEAIGSKGNKNSEKMNITAARLGPSVYFPKSRYEVNEGDDFNVVLSAVNPTGPKMEALLIIKPPGNGVSIYESWCKGLEGMCTGKYEIDPGDAIKSISMKMRADKAGEYQIDAEVYYQFDGSQRSPTRYETLTLVVKPKQTPNPVNTQAQSTPGFEFLSGVFGLLIIVLKVKGGDKNGKLKISMPKM